MSESLATVIGMTIAYAASFLGLILAWYSYNKHQNHENENE